MIESFLPLIEAPDGLPKLIARLSDEHSVSIIAQSPGDSPSADFNVWDACAKVLRDSQRYHDAIALYSRLYDGLLVDENAKPGATERSRALVWLSECYMRLGCPALAQRYLMLTLIEEAIAHKGQHNPTGGVYWRARWQYGMSDADVQRYYASAYRIAQEDQIKPFFPEWIFEKFGHGWRTVWPSTQEALRYVVTQPYAKWLFARMDEAGVDANEHGIRLEQLATYLMSAIPGCRAQKAQTHSTDYDLVCALEGAPDDFRLDLGRYFICECKNWEKPADFTTVAKFGIVLKSANCRFGVIFSANGITGAGANTDAERQALKLCQGLGIVVVVLDRTELARIVDGDNLISILRTKYEERLLDLRGPLGAIGPTQDKPAKRRQKTKSRRVPN